MMKAVWLAVALMLVQPVWAAMPGADDVEYVVKSGDTLGDLARTQLDVPTRWRDVANYNLIPNPDVIEPGQQLRFKRIWLKASSGKLKVEAVSGEATADGRTLVVGDEVAVGATVQTAAGGALRLRLPDASLVNMLEQGEVKVERLDQRADNTFLSLLRLVTGQLDAFKSKHEVGAADMAVAGRSGTIGVRGTHFRIRQVGNTTYAEIEEGSVGFAALRTPYELALNARQGSVADGQKPAEVIPLLPEPVYPQLPNLFDTPYIEWEMGELDGATNYVGELAQNELYSDRLVSIRSSGKHILLPELSNGRYWLKLRAVDRHGLQGMEGKIAFEVNVPPRQFAMTKVYVSGKQLQLRWVGRKQSVSYQVQVAPTQDFTRLLLDAKTSDNWVDMPRPAAGRYFLRVRQIFSDGRGGAWDVPMMFEAP